MVNLEVCVNTFVDTVRPVCLIVKHEACKSRCIAIDRNEATAQMAKV